MRSPLATRIKELREGSDLSLNTLASLLGVAVSTLSRMESGQLANPSLAILERLCAFFGVNRDWLIEGKGEKFIQEDPRIARDRYFKLMEEAGAPDGPAYLREQKLLTEFSSYLAQAPHANDDTWRRYAKAMEDAVADYREFCKKHFATARAAGLKAARAAASSRLKK